MKLKSIFFMGVAVFFPTVGVLAQTLEAIPGQTGAAGANLLTDYLNNLYKFGISITGILAIFMIGVGAFAYIVTSVGNSSKMMDAKETIQNALIGLVIALTAYLLLFVINPDLVGGTLNAPSTAITAITAITATDPSAQGCCLSNYAATCVANSTYADCGTGNAFVENPTGSSYVCGDNPANSGYKMCNPSSAPPVAPVAQTGCCIYYVGMLVKCDITMNQDDCELDGLVNPNWTAGDNFTCSSASGSPMNSNVPTCVAP